MPINPGRPIRIADTLPDNEAVLAYLARDAARDARGDTHPLSNRPGDHTDPYMRLGAHPDIVEWVWDRLGGALLEDARCVVHGTPALAEPTSGRVVAVVLGTTYALRLTPDDLPAALEAGARAEHRYGTGDALDLTTWGVGWVFGTFAAREHEWIRATFDRARGLAGRVWTGDY